MGDREKSYEDEEGSSNFCQLSACHPREGGDPVNDAAAERTRTTVASLPHSELPVVTGSPPSRG